MHPVPPLASHSLLVFLAAIAVLLAVARLLGRLAERIGMPAIVGELATGVMLGPSLLLHVLPGVSHWLFPADANQMHLLDGIAQVSAVLLVGVTGTQLDLGLLRRMGGTALTVSGLNLIAPLALGVTLGLFLPATVVASGHTSRVVLALFIGVTKREEWEMTDTWDGVERLPRAVVLCRRPVRRPTLRGVRADLRARRGQVTVTGRCAAAAFNATVEASRSGDATVHRHRHVDRPTRTSESEQRVRRT